MVKRLFASRANYFDVFAFGCCCWWAGRGVSPLKLLIPLTVLALFSGFMVNRLFKEDK